MSNTINIGILGASGYTGFDLIRLSSLHANVNIKYASANTNAGEKLSYFFPHLNQSNIDTFKKWEDCNWDSVDVIFSCLPHGNSQDIIKNMPDNKIIIDLSADFRLKDPEVYKAWYGRDHESVNDKKLMNLLQSSVYGLSEWYRDDIKSSNLIACPGCYPTASLLCLAPGVKSGMLDVNSIVIDAKSGISGAGRSAKKELLFCEVGEGAKPYSVVNHRHIPEIEQELSKLSNISDIKINFTPHLVPMSRGEIVTIHTKLNDGSDFNSLFDFYKDIYKETPFVKILDSGINPDTLNVRGSNMCHIALYKDRMHNSVTIIGVIDNLVKGSSGQALQNMNIRMGWNEMMGLNQIALFP
jgi:N-acetyl-gamma-glutamyl-phosphate reductase